MGLIDVGINTGMGAFGPQQVPVFYLVSTQNVPSNKNLQIQSQYPLIYIFTTLQGAPLGVSQAPSGTSPLVANWTFPAIPYPATINVEVRDAASWMTLTTTTLNLNGGDVYLVRITYTEHFPGANGYITANVDGMTQTISAQQYAMAEFNGSESWPRGTD